MEPSAHEKTVLQLRPYIPRLLSLFKPYKLLVIFTLLLLGLYSAIQLALPWGAKIIFDDVLHSGKYDLLQYICGGLFIAAVLMMITGFWHTYLALIFTARLLTDLSLKTFRHLQNLSLGDVQEIKSGEAFNIVMNDSQTIAFSLFYFIYTLIRSGLILVFSLAVLFYLHWVMTLIILGFVAVYIIFYYLWINQLTKGFRQIREDTGKLSNEFQETVRGFVIVKGYGAEKRSILRFLQRVNLLLRYRLKVQRVHARYIAMNDFFIATGLITILLYGSIQISQGHLTVGELIAFYGYLLLIGGPVSSLSNMFITMQQVLVSAERLFKFLDRVPQVRESENPIVITDLKGAVSIRGVSFEYLSSKAEDGTNRPAALRNISLEVKPGEVMAFVGPTGSGKTTLAYLIARLYDANSGAVEIDGVNVKKLKLSSYHHQLGFVTQSSLLFDGTIFENIAFARPNATMDEVIAASKSAGLDEFVATLKDRYETQVGESGVKLSGGQQQLVAIARAFLSNPKILILDEPTSSLDAHSEEKFQTGLRNLLKGRTTFIIAHRLSTVLFADRIIYLEHGEIIETGSHRDLLAKNGLYAKLYAKQRQMMS